MRRVVRAVGVGLSVLGVGLIAYAGLAGNGGGWIEAPLGSNEGIMLGVTGYLIGGICVIGGLGTLVAVETKR